LKNKEQVIKPALSLYFVSEPEICNIQIQVCSFLTFHAIHCYWLINGRYWL